MNQPKLTRKEWNMITMMLEKQLKRGANKAAANETRSALKKKILSQLNRTRDIELVDNNKH
ncbi:MAG: hypothetical protein Unbinned1520contig1002_30 [Prokaryotic dsDNA virus sp.]|nr:MAG: hypothetical protein Unbinned1520contig1002_30 [Prokaryotic dsDNA virus sp.]|tara:strand:+ start:5721 stop:5903 length:183 start_codon:yes stop_codon:yes gene_type:complete